MNAIYCRDYMKLTSKLIVLQTFIFTSAIYFVSACAYSMMVSALFLIPTKQPRRKSNKYLVLRIESACSPIRMCVSSY